MPQANDPGSDDIALAHAREIFQNWTPFAGLSRRLLADLLDRCIIHRLSGGPDSETAIYPIKERSEDPLPADKWVPPPLLAFLVVSGDVELVSLKPRRKKRLPRIEVGVPWLRDELPAGILALKRTTNTTSAPDSLVALLHHVGLTPEVAWSLDESKMLGDTGTRDRPKKTARGGGKVSKPPPTAVLRMVTAKRRSELIWCAQDPRFDLPLEPLVHLLAGRVVRDLGEPTAVVVLGSDPFDVVVYDVPENAGARANGNDQPALTVRTGHGDPAKLAAWALREILPDDQRSRVFVLDGAGDDPRAAGSLLGGFDRIIYLTDDTPRAVPAHLRGLLRPEVFVGKTDGEPFYCSFISSLVVEPKRRRRRKFHARAVRFARRGEGQDQYEFLNRLDRDSCVIHVDRHALARAWDAWRGDQPEGQAFVDHPAEKGVSVDTQSRWARAVTNRRVGIAVSGGGACAYRAGAVLAQMKRAEVPIDVFAGLSGGALVGAFFCHAGLAGLARIVAMGRFIQMTAPLALATTWPLEAVVDYELGGAHRGCWRSVSPRSPSRCRPTSHRSPASSSAARSARRCESAEPCRPRLRARPRAA